MKIRQEIIGIPSTHKGSFISLVGWFCVFLFEVLGKVGVELGYGERNLEKMR